MTKRTDRELIELTKELVGIESIADKPQELRKAYNLMVDHLKSYGKAITIEEFESNGVPSFLAYKAGRRPEKFDVMLNGHLDVVTGEPHMFKAVEEDGKLYGRGIYDMKAAVVIMADAFCEAVEDSPLLIGLQIVCDEEIGGSDGTAYQILQGVRADFTIAGEAGRKLGVYEIGNEAKGAHFVEVEFNGQSAHGAYPWKAQSAARHAIAFAEAIHDLYPTPEQECDTPTVTVTAIQAGAGVPNRVPDHATVTLDIRSIPGKFDTPESVVDFLQGVDASAKVHFINSGAPAYADPDGHYIQILKKQAEAVEGHAFNFVRRNGGSDTRHFIEVGGQAYDFGIAGEDHHGDKEYITLEAFLNFRKTLQRFLKTVTVPSSAQRKAKVLQVVK